MNKDISEILMRIQSIEKRPMMYCQSDTFQSMEALISGYFLGLDTALKMDLNAQFRDWIYAKTPKWAQSWSECIFRFMAENDEVRAREILFSELKAFLGHLIKENS